MIHVFKPHYLQTLNGCVRARSVLWHTQKRTVEQYSNAHLLNHIKWLSSGGLVIILFHFLPLFFLHSTKNTCFNDRHWFPVNQFCGFCSSSSDLVFPLTPVAPWLLHTLCYLSLCNCCYVKTRVDVMRTVSRCKLKHVRHQRLIVSEVRRRNAAGVCGQMATLEMQCVRVCVGQRASGGHTQLSKWQF